MAEVLDYERFQEAVKLMALYQCTLEQMDSFKNTRLFKQSVRNKMNSLEKDIEFLIREPIKKLDVTDEEVFNEIQMKIDMVMDLSLTELTQLKVVVEEHREKE